jgi:hypothetical protein
MTAAREAEMADALNQEPRQETGNSRETTTTPSWGRRFGYLCAILANLAVLWVVRRLGQWDLHFITAQWSQVLPAMELSIYGDITAHLTYLFYDARWFRRLGQIGMNVLSFLAVRSLYRVFPFAFQSSLVESGVRIGLMVASIALVIATVVEIARLVLARD